jgi:hypothetical protein
MVHFIREMLSRLFKMSVKVYNAQPFSHEKSYCLLYDFGVFLGVRNIHNLTQEFHSHLYFGLVDHLFHRTP